MACTTVCVKAQSAHHVGPPHGSSVSNDGAAVPLCAMMLPEEHEQVAPGVFFADALLRWYRLNCRDFPWRRHPHPYAIWVCEVMSQQTVMSVLLPKYRAFFEALPTVQHLAACSDQLLRQLWSGLGYYARARNLKKAAQVIVDDYGGEFPQTFEGWLALPGCGPYTAAMVASVCGNQPAVAVDGNIIRVVYLLCLISDTGIWTPNGRERIVSFLQPLISQEHPGDFNQALMELGALVCRKAQPLCGECPLSGVCVSYAQNKVTECPPVKPRRAMIEKSLMVALIFDEQGRMATCYRETGLLKKTTGLLLCDNACLGENDHEFGNDLGFFRHTITHHKITARVLKVSAHQVSWWKDIWGATTINWVDPDDWTPETALDQKAIALLQKVPSKSWSLF